MDKEKSEMADDAFNVTYIVSEKGFHITLPHFYSIMITPAINDRKVLYLAGCSTINNGFDEDSQVCVIFLGAIAFDTDTQTCRAWVTQGDLKGQELSGTVRSQDQFILLRLLQKGEGTRRPHILDIWISDTYQNLHYLT